MYFNTSESLYKCSSDTYTPDLCQYLTFNQLTTTDIQLLKANSKYFNR